MQPREEDTRSSRSHKGVVRRPKRIRFSRSRKPGWRIYRTRMDDVALHVDTPHTRDVRWCGPRWAISVWPGQHDKNGRYNSGPRMGRLRGTHLDKRASGPAFQPTAVPSSHPVDSRQLRDRRSTRCPRAGTRPQSCTTNMKKYSALKMPPLCSYRARFQGHLVTQGLRLALLPAHPS